MDQIKYDLIITIVNRGFADQVMDAAKAAGATGGTILHARGAGVHETDLFFGVPIQPEKELVLTLVPAQSRIEIMQSIVKQAGLNTQGRGLTFSLPVLDMAGVVHLMGETKDELPQE